MGAVTLQGVLKYLVYRMPSHTTYDTAGIPDTSYERALDLATSIEEDASAASKDLHKFLPNCGISWMINENLSSYLSYGRNYGMSVALYPYFISQKNSFYLKGITLQDLWDRQELETADNFDVGLRYITDKLYLVPTSRGTGGEAAKRGYLVEKFIYIKNRITRHLSYPLVARRLKWQGIVVVTFFIAENGLVENNKISSSSGHQLLDNHVIDTVKWLQPFPKPPVKAEITIPVNYVLRGS